MTTFNTNQCNALIALLERPLTPPEVAERLHVPLDAAAAVLEGLSDQGWLVHDGDLFDIDVHYRRTAQTLEDMLEDRASA
jgi:hypothetical protein